MHGTETTVRAYVPYDTRGCVALANGDLDELGRLIEIDKTPVVIVEGLRNLPFEAVEKEKKEVLDFLEAWKRSWTEGRLQPYLGSYSDEFSAGGMDIEKWKEHKGRLNSLYREVHVGVENVAILKEKERRI